MCAQVLPPAALNVFIPTEASPPLPTTNEEEDAAESAAGSKPAGPKLRHVSLMSRYLNGAGMGFTAKAAKLAANNEIWAAGANAVKEYRTQESLVRSRAREVGASLTIIRAGTLKGGANANGEGEPTFLASPFYDLGAQACARTPHLAPPRV
jgi:hypothetical protein